MELKLGDLVDNLTEVQKFCTHIAVQMHFTGFPNKLQATIGFSNCARNGPPRAAASVSTKERQKKWSGHMIKCLLTELGRAGRENIWLSVRTHGPRCARSVRPDFEPNIFPSGPPTQSISTYYFPPKSHMNADSARVCKLRTLGTNFHI